MAFSRFPERESIVSRPMFVAAANGEISKIEQLLAKGVDVNCIHKATGRTPLIEATIANQLGAVRTLLVAGANINHQDTAVGYSALMWASGNGNAKIVKCLLEAGADVNARSPQFGWTPLLCAASVSLAVVDLLLDASADCTMATTDGRTAVAIAQEARKSDIVKTLTALGCTADNPLVVPPSRPWPALNKQTSNVDYGDPVSVVRGLIIEMNRFEKAAQHTKSLDEILKLQNAVYERFCTPKPRPYGRNGSYQSPPEYHPSHEYLIDCTLPNPRRAEVFTRNDDNIPTEYLYVLVKKGGRWLVDSKKYRFVGGEWSAWSI